MVANLYGDFVKGKDYSYLPEIVQKGVYLHRTIDDFIDHHDAVTELRLRLYQDLPKIAGIAIDLYFDYFLANNWKRYHTKSLSTFVDDFFDFSLKDKNLQFENNFSYPDSFVHLLSIMYERNWLNRYQEFEGIDMAANGLSKIISFDNNLHEAVPVLKQNYDTIEDCFSSFMHDAIKKFHLNDK